MRRRRGAGGIRTLTALAVLFASAMLVGCGAAVFECDGEQDCVGGGAEGVCQSDGWCSFADGACPSGQRYGERAPAGIANTCVDPDLDASTGIAGTDTDPSTTAGSMTSTGAMTTSTTDATSTSTTDATTDPTTSMTTPDTITSSPTSDTASSSDSARDPVCGDGVIDPESEQCEGSDFGGLDCGSFGFDGGTLVCEQCSVSTAGCSDCAIGCPTMCSGADDCSDIESCVVAVMGMGGSCWPQCMDDNECSMFFMGTACFQLEAGPACLFPCDMNDQCPEGLTCSLLQDMQLACL